MKVLRKAEIENPAEFKVGDQIDCGFGLATCQKVSEEGALFFTDDYDNEIRERTDLLEYLNSEEGLAGFSDEIRERLVGEVRVPYAEEMFPKDEIDFLEEDDCEQLPLMKERRNRIAFCQDDWEWGWLMNRSKRYAANFGLVTTSGNAHARNASLSAGVRRAFLIK
mgnify:CR=1 FL=1